MKEFFRKRMVALKRKPQVIAMVVLGLAFVYYSLNLTHVSNTTAYVQGAGMGLSAFVIMLFSVLSLVCFLNAFPHRKKVNVPMLVLMFAMMAGVLGCGFYYEQKIDEKIENVRLEALTIAQNTVRNAQEGAAAAPSYVTAAKKSVTEAEKTLKSVEDVKAKVEAANLVTTAAASTQENAVKNADKAVKNAGTQVSKAQKAHETAVASADSAKQTVSTLLEAANYEELLNSARSAVNAGTRAATSATEADTAVKNAKLELEKANEALATVDVWTAMKRLETQMAASGKTAVTTTASKPAVSPAVKVPAPLELPQAIVDEALAMGDVAVHDFLTDKVAVEQNGEKVEKEVPSSYSLAKSMLNVHRIMLLVAALLTALLPVYTPLIRKVKTSVEVEANEDMGEIELDGSDE